VEQCSVCQLLVHLTKLAYAVTRLYAATDIPTAVVKNNIRITSPKRHIRQSEFTKYKQVLIYMRGQKTNNSQYTGQTTD